jgi:hypothetical protein
MADDQFTDAIAPSLERGWVKEDVRAALGESRLGANARLREANEMVQRLPDTLEQARIWVGHAHAHALADQVHPWIQTRRGRSSVRYCPAPRRRTRQVPGPWSSQPFCRAHIQSQTVSAR